MAGDWMKVEKSTPDKPEIFAIAEILSIDPDVVFGKCFRVWSWFDEHTTNGKGNAVSVSKMLVDRLVAVTGFADAMVSVGWLEEDGNGIAASNFDRHNGKTAKLRASTAKRVAAHKAKCNGKGNAESVTDALPDALPREEKSKHISTTDVVDNAGAKRTRFDAGKYLLSLGIDKQTADDWLAVRKAKKAAPTKTAIDGVSSEASKAGITLAKALEVCCRQGWAGFKASWDWNPSRHASVQRPETGRQAAIRNYSAQAAAARGDVPKLDAIEGESHRVA